jgi:oligopeptide/dipeptide ABC transporter ATP-binding protein
VTAATAAAPPVLEVKDLSVRFRPRGRDLVHAVSGLTYSVPAGRTVAIIGESGSGKTASSRAIMGLLPRSAQVSGSVRLSGTELTGLSPRALRRHRGQDVAMIFQDPARSLNPTMKVGPQVAEAVRAHGKVSRAEARERVIELFKLVRLSAPGQRYDEYPHQFSGGMRQRVMIAMALSCRPKLLIADEATTALDVTTQAQIMELLLELQAELGMALIMISHDLGLAASYADEVIVMYAGKIVEQAQAKRLFGAGGSVKMRYTRALLDAIPHIEREAHTQLPVVTGRPPDPTALPPGCSFAPRCAHAQDDCTAKAPALAEHSPGHSWACWHPCENGVAQ